MFFQRRASIFSRFSIAGRSYDTAASLAQRGKVRESRVGVKNPSGTAIDKDGDERRDLYHSRRMERRELRRFGETGP